MVDACPVCSDFRAESKGDFPGALKAPGDGDLSRGDTGQWCLPSPGVFVPALRGLAVEVEEWEFGGWLLVAAVDDRAL